MPKADLGPRIRQLRETRKISQVELADKLNMTQSQISKMEKGMRRVYADELEDVANALGITINDILKIS